MNTRIRRILVSLACLSTLLSGHAAADSTPPFATPGPCKQSNLASGARALICVPRTGWNGDLVIYAHGFVSPFAPLTFANLDLPDGTNIPELVQKLGFAFAATTYRQNGLAILEGVDDIVDLVKAFPILQYGPPGRTYLTGVSEGGLVVVLAAEQYPELFDAAYATCGPIGDFPFQINYVGDVRTLFDVYFPGVLPGSAVDVPRNVTANWNAVYVPAIRMALESQPARARELLNVAHVPYDPAEPATITEAATRLLWQHAFGASDARVKLGGNPYGNRFRWFSGSANDVSLNLRVKRVDADVPALAKLQRYTPTGDLRIPLVTLHTTGDDLVPYAHELLYGVKVRTSNRGRLLQLPILRHGHCAFRPSEVLTGFAVMLGASYASAPSVGPVADAASAPAAFAADATAYSQLR